MSAFRPPTQNRLLEIEQELLRQRHLVIEPDWQPEYPVVPRSSKNRFHTLVSDIGFDVSDFNLSDTHSNELYDALSRRKGKPSYNLRHDYVDFPANRSEIVETGEIVEEAFESNGYDITDQPDIDENSSPFSYQHLARYLRGESSLPDRSVPVSPPTHLKPERKQQTSHSDQPSKSPRTQSFAFDTDEAIVLEYHPVSASVSLTSPQAIVAPVDEFVEPMDEPQAEPIIHVTDPPKADLTAPELPISGSVLALPPAKVFPLLPPAQVEQVESQPTVPEVTLEVCLARAIVALTVIRLAAEQNRVLCGSSILAIADLFPGWLQLFIFQSIKADSSEDPIELTLQSSLIRAPPESSSNLY